MSVVGNNRVGIPIVLLHDAEGGVVTVETVDGELIRGLLFEAEDMMNLYIKKAVIVNQLDPGRSTSVDQVYIRGSRIMFIVLPEMLSKAPMFRRYVSAPSAPSHREIFSFRRRGACSTDAFFL
mmetsp:Transcript_18722/g.42751  ORF Transcript_18722/g.42751 Transcript_18722/m.42751 type:complete len:123 (-) Transcript_18722:306-674(-)